MSNRHTTVKTRGGARRVPPAMSVPLLDKVVYVLLIFGALIELTQGLTPYRSTI